MKLKETLILLATALLCTLLFYKQSWGLNVPVFALLIVWSQVWSKPELKHNRSWLWASFATIVSALGYYFTNNSGAAILFIVSIVFSSGLQIKDALLIFLPVHAFLNFFIAPFALIQDRVSSWLKGEHLTKRISLRMFLVPFLIFTVFLLVYASANSMLWEQLSALFAYHDVTFLFSLLLSFLIVLPILRGRIVGWISGLETICEKIVGFVSEPHPINDQLKMSRLMKEALIVFCGLIVLLTYLIVLDGIQLFSTSTVQSLSENLHGSIYILIASMFMAIGVILYYFSLPLIYHDAFKKIKGAVTVWIALNILLCIICLIKNNVYVEELGLTYKRIGVYTYLITTVLSLLITAYKTNASLNNWLLIKANSWMVYGILVLFTCIPWDIVITRYNLKYTQKPDLMYIQSLSNRAQLEYIHLMLKEHDTWEERALLNVQMQQEYDNLPHSILHLKEQPFLSLTAEDRRMIKQYEEVSQLLKP